jgi:hypothetical protein
MTTAREIIERAMRLYPDAASLTALDITEFEKLQDIIADAINKLRGAGVSVPSILVNYKGLLDQVAATRVRGDLRRDPQDQDIPDPDLVDPNDLGYTSGEGSSILQQASDWLKAQEFNESNLAAIKEEQKTLRAKETQKIVLMGGIALAILALVYFLKK